MSATSGLVLAKGHPRSASGRSLIRTIRQALPSTEETKETNLWRIKNLPNILRGLIPILLAKILGIPTYYGALYIRTRRANGSTSNLGLASLRCLTKAGAAAITDLMRWEDRAPDALGLPSFRYHAVGIGTNAESPDDTTLQAEVSETHTLARERAKGTVGRGDDATVFRSTATITFTKPTPMTEHGIFACPKPGADDVLLDRSAFGVKTFGPGDSYMPVYELALLPE